VRRALVVLVIASACCCLPASAGTGPIDWGLQSEPVSWSADGGTLYFSSNRRAPGPILIDLYSVRRDRGGLRHFFPIGGDEAFFLSPNGRRTAVLRGNTLLIQDADGSRVVPIAHPTSPTWAPDSSKLAVTDCGGREGCVVNFVDAATGHVTGTTQQVVGQVVWSPNSRLLAFRGRELVGIYEPASDKLLSGVFRRDAGLPVWAPGSDQIAFKAEPQGGLYPRVHVLAVGSNVPGVLANTVNPVSWSPDGTRIAFDNGGIGRPYGLRWVAADGGDTHPLFPTHVSVALSPDWKWVAFSDWSYNGTDLFIQQLGHAARRVGPSQCLAIAGPCAQGSDRGELTKGPYTGTIFLAGGGDDVVYGRGGNDWIEGSLGRDRLFGGSANDVLWGGVGDDVVYGGEGDDTLRGGAGHDRVDGGPGNDEIFAVDHVRDVIRCGPGVDRVLADSFDVTAGCEHRRVR
jgi:hypothetical protein